MHTSKTSYIKPEYNMQRQHTIPYLYIHLQASHSKNKEYTDATKSCAPRLTPYASSAHAQQSDRWKTGAQYCPDLRATRNHLLYQGTTPYTNIYCQKIVLTKFIPG